MGRGSIHGSGKVGAANLFGARRGEGNDWLAAAQSAAEDWLGLVLVTNSANIDGSHYELFNFKMHSYLVVCSC